MVAENTGSEHEEHGPADPHGQVVGGKGKQQEEGDHDEDGQRRELALQVGLGTLLDGGPDLLHALRPGEVASTSLRNRRPITRAAREMSRTTTTMDVPPIPASIS